MLKELKGGGITNMRQMKDIRMSVTDIHHFSDTLYLIRLEPLFADLTIPPFLPGQFVQLRIAAPEVLLRRPISIYGGDEHHLELLVQVAGKATEYLAHARVGEEVDVLGPLGNHFASPVGEEILLVGGGVGVAPLLTLGRSLRAEGHQPTFLLGARAESFFPDLTPFEEVGQLLTTTEDGSLGERGFVTSHSVWESRMITDIYCCGPTPMMKAVAEIARERGIHCQVSLENMMACGVGICLCCVEPTVRGNVCVCTEGPVFDIDDLLW